MRWRALRPMAALGMSAAAMAASSSCTLPTLDAAEQANTTSQAEPVLTAGVRGQAWPSITQVDHGQQAQFVICGLAVCDQVTPKTLALESPVELTPWAVAATPQLPISSHRHLDFLALANGPAEVNMPNASDGQVAVRSEPPAAPVKTVVLTFAPGSATLTPTARRLIDDAVRAPAIQRITIRGRTDRRGSASANTALARLRVAAVTRYLRARHRQLDAAERVIDARGQCCYAAPNNTVQGRARNRRVEISLERGP